MSQTFKYPTDSVFANDSAFGKTNSGKERFVIFHCYDYKIRNKKSLDNISLENTRLVTIALHLPNSFQEDISQDWSTGVIFSGSSVVGKGINWLKSKLGDSIGNLGTARLGIAPNPSEELLFSGPGLRVFSFSYDFTPRNQQELTQIKAIVASFKRFSLPLINKSSLFIQFPAIWKMDISGIDGDVDDTNFVMFGIKDRPMALTDVGINYTPEGSFISFHDGFPIKISLSLTLRELKPLYREISNMSDDEGKEIIDNISSGGEL